MSIRKSLLRILGIFFLLALVSCNSADTNIVLRRPTGLACSVPSYNDGAIIRWNAVEYAKSYKVFIDNQEIGNTNSNWFHFSYEDSYLYCGKSCTIQALDDNGGISIMSNALIIPDKAPINVQNIDFYFTVSKQNDNSLLVEWQDVHAEIYEIYIDEQKIAETKSLYYLIDSEKAFIYNNAILSVKAIENDPKVEFIPTKYIIMAPIMINAPVINYSNDLNGNFVIKWNEVSGAVSYNVYVDGAQYATNIKNLEYAFVNTPDFTDSKISIASVDQFGRISDFSNECLYQHIVKTPYITGSILENGDLMIEWNQIAHASKYAVYWRNRLVSPEYTMFETNDTQIVLTKEDILQDAEQYEVYVIAEDDHEQKSKKSNIYRWQVTLDKPVIHTSIPMAIFTTMMWYEVENAVKYEVYIDGELYKEVDTKYCDISNSVLRKYQDKVITIIAISKQGIRSLVSEGYDLN